MSKSMKGIKRNRNDIFRSVVGSYLRKRRYIDPSQSLKKSELELNQSVKDMVADAALGKDVSHVNSVTYTSIKVDPDMAKKQYFRLRFFVSQIQDEACKREAITVLLPIFYHMYLDLFCKGYRVANNVLHSVKRTLHHTSSEQCSIDIIEEMKSISIPQDIDLYPLMRSFRAGRYKTNLSPKTSSMLRVHLTNNGSLFLLKILHKWFEFETFPDASTLLEDDEPDNDKHYEDPCKTYEKESKAVFAAAAASTGAERMKLLQDSMKTVREGSAFPNPIFIYRIENLEQGCCANVYQSIKLLATGTLASEVRLSYLSESNLSPSCTINIPLGCDFKPAVYTQQETRCAVLRGHCAPVCDVGFLPEAELLLSASYDTTMRAWRIGDYSCAAVYRGHNYPLWCLAVSPLGLHIATGSKDRTARIWNLDRTYPLRVLAGHTEDVNCIRFHPNNCYIATGSVDRSVRMWCVSGGNLVRVFPGHTGSIQGLAFSPNGKYLASAGDGGRVKIWDLAAGGILANLKGTSSRAIALDWSKCGSILASGSHDGILQMWDMAQILKTGQSEESSSDITGEKNNLLYQYNTHCRTLYSVQFSIRNTCIVVGTDTLRQTNLPPPTPSPAR